MKNERNENTFGNVGQTVAMEIEEFEFAETGKSAFLHRGYVGVAQPNLFQHFQCGERSGRNSRQAAVVDVQHLQDAQDAEGFNRQLRQFSANQLNLLKRCIDSPESVSLDNLQRCVGDSQATHLDAVEEGAVQAADVRMADRQVIDGRLDIVHADRQRRQIGVAAF